MGLYKQELKTNKKQQGIALVVSLVFLVMITIIGVASIRGTTLNEMMVSNNQQRIATFQVAESVIEGIWDVSYILENTPSTLTNPPAITLYTDNNNQTFNQTYSLPAASDTSAIGIDAYATLQYCGEDSSQLGNQLSADLSKPAFIAHVYNINSHSKISSTQAASHHEKRGFVIRPKVGRTGNCP